MQACVNYSFWQDSENNLQKMVVYLGSLRNTTVIILDQNAMNYCIFLSYWKENYGSRKSTWYHQFQTKKVTHHILLLLSTQT